MRNGMPARLICRAWVVTLLSGNLGSVAFVRAQQPAADDQEQRATAPGKPTAGQDRAYRSKRERSLSERERFSTRNLPTGHAIIDGLRDGAAAEGYDRGYEDGFEDGLRAAQRALAGERRTTLRDAAVAQGREHFRNGRYGAAARNFILAAKNDQGDPISRLQAAHSMVALRHYDDAFLLLRRAFQLQPNLAYAAIDVRGAYSNQSEFNEHLSRLAKDATATDDDPRLWALVGYYQLFSGNHSSAFTSLSRASELAPKDKFVAHLLEVARMSTPASHGGKAVKPPAH